MCAGRGNWNKLWFAFTHTIKSCAKQRTGSCDVLPHPSTTSSSSASAQFMDPATVLGSPCPQVGGVRLPRDCPVLGSAVH